MTGALCSSISLYCCVGNDREGRVIIEKLSEHGIDPSGIAVVSKRNTLTKIRFYGSRESLLDKSQILLQADRGPRDELPNSVFESLTEQAMSSLGDSCAIVLSDYDKGVLNAAGARALIDAASKAGLPVIMDPKLTGLDRSRGADVVLFEKRGLDLLSRRQMASDPADAAKSLIEEHDWGAMLLNQPVLLCWK
jgi:D-beta-D-heptose 7-phosphate kinase/D-beta-D-heptose 1-phosphate adenosyltransferase